MRFEMKFVTTDSTLELTGKFLKYIPGSPNCLSMMVYSIDPLENPPTTTGTLILYPGLDPAIFLKAVEK